MLNHPKNSGIVTIIGEVNVGKSSLLNILVKKDVSIITHKSNTTNKQIKGIKNYKNSQIVFIDTPGLYINKGKTNRNFLSEIWSAVTEADFLCIVIDGNRTVSKVLYQLLEQINEKNIPEKSNIIILPYPLYLRDVLPRYNFFYLEKPDANLSLGSRLTASIISERLKDLIDVDHKVLHLNFSPFLNSDLRSRYLDIDDDKIDYLIKKYPNYKYFVTENDHKLNQSHLVLEFYL